MNIVVIMTDQLSFRTLRAYGGNERFPAIDSFFENGATVDQVYTPCPLCLPARASFWTSRLPHRTGALSNGRKFTNKEVPATTPSLGSLFSAAGWECVHFGKEHDAGALHGFTRMPWGQTEVEPELGYPVNMDTFHDRFTTDQVVDWFAARESDAAGASPLVAVVDLVNPHNICGWVGEMARQVLGDEADVIPPPLRAASYEATPGFPPQTPTDSLPELPPNHKDADFHTRPRSVQYQCCAHNRLAQTQGWGEREFRLYIDAYHHYTGLVDAEIARILAAARSALDMSDTYVVFTSDHGDAIAAHAGATKHTTFYEETTRVPFAVTGPDITPGARVTGAASLLDLVPTLLELAHINDQPAVRNAMTGMDGISLAAALRSGSRMVIERATAEPHEEASTPTRCVVSEWHTEWGFTIEPGRMITDGRFKLMRYAEGGEEEFYDLLSDPYEMRNLATSDPSGGRPPGADRALARLRTALDEHLERSDDPFSSLEAYAPAQWRSHEPGYHNHQGIAAPQAPVS